MEDSTNNHIRIYILVLYFYIENYRSPQLINLNIST